jgi:hypothetical protein
MKNKYIFEQLKERVELFYVETFYSDVTDFEFKWRRYDFIVLAEAIDKRIERPHYMPPAISFETVKRIFTGKFEVGDKIHKTKIQTLNKLCQFIDYNKWDDFAAEYRLPKQEITESDVERQINLIIELLHDKKVSLKKRLMTPSEILDYYKAEKRLIVDIWHNSLTKIYRKEQVVEMYYAEKWAQVHSRVRELEKQLWPNRPNIIGKINLDELGQNYDPLFHSIRYARKKRKPRWKR